MTKVTIEEVQARLPELLDATPPGDGFVIFRNGEPLAELTRISPEEGHPIPGRCKGMLAVLSDDDEHLDAWIEYMP